MRLTAALALAFAATAFAQTPAAVAQIAASSTPTITSQSTLVLVPALVRDKSKSGQLVFALNVNDFALTDDGIPQKLHLEENSDASPLALVVDIEGGGAGAAELAKYEALAPMLESVVGGVPHKIAIVGFDSSPVLVQDFTENNDLATKAIHDLIEDDSGDDKAAILDSLNFSVELLRKQPVQYRRAILLLAESHDRNSISKLDEAVRAISDTNTAIYAIGFSSGIADSKRDTPLAEQRAAPGPAHGCMSRDPNDPNVDLSKSVAHQAVGCLDILAPPLALAQAAFLAIRDSFEKNIPEAVAHLTGGEYFKLTNAKSLDRDLQTISNHIPNRYVLSFQPQSPHPGFHSIQLTVPSYAHMEVSARSGYWQDTPATSAKPTPR